MTPFKTLKTALEMKANGNSQIRMEMNVKYTVFYCFAPTPTIVSTYMQNAFNSMQK